MSDLKRRTFIKNTLLAGVSASLAPQMLSAAKLEQKQTDKDYKTLSSSKKKIIVAGAGISGLCCGYELMKKGHDVTILEASGRYGGHIFTGRDGLSDGLYADYGADHITKPGYERFFDYVKEFNLTVIPYPHAEGSEAAPNSHTLKMIGGKFYSPEMLQDATVLKGFGFNEKEIEFLSHNPLYAFRSLYIDKYTGNFKDAYQPFSVGYDELDKISVYDLTREKVHRIRR